MLNTLKELCALSGVSSWEDETRAFIRAQAEPYADSIRTDAMGNLIVFKKGRRRLAIACCFPHIWMRSA